MIRDSVTRAEVEVEDRTEKNGAAFQSRRRYHTPISRGIGLVFVIMRLS